MLTADEIVREAAEAGFQPEPMEKALRLLDLLNAIRAHPFLKNRVALKGGTALNLFVFDLPRLSVDLDFNYVGAADRETMLAERPKMEEALRAVCGRLGFQIRRSAPEHAGGKWRLSYTDASGRSGGLSFDLNYLLRTPLWPVSLKESRAIGSFRAVRVPVLDRHELAAGKLAALFGRRSGRDLFDVHGLLKGVKFERSRLRLGFVVYGGISRRDWREISTNDIRADPVEIERQLLPMLRIGTAPARADIRSWIGKLEEETRELLSILLPLESQEREFLTLLNERGVIAPALLTSDERMREIIGIHPGLQWKALNVREHRMTAKLSAGDE